ncbi:MAG TPA: serine/threonine-protein kinase [Bryobacteraceae bacterium]|nr:serine/threonine-protein kinase [Bryobacteraceae bacterium]
MDRPVDPSFLETTPLNAAPPSPVSRDSSSPASGEGRFVPGTVLGGRYRIIGLLGRGGMGEVYRATDLTLDQSVALKFLPVEMSSNPGLLARFHGEVRIARQVSHPNVCRVYDIGEVQGMPFISMEYVDGEDLSSLLLRIGRLPADKALEIARKLCAGLAAAHDRGIIHRDLKPQNVMIDKRGEVVIMDFGLAAIAGQLSGAEVRNGTPAYMAPEQLKGAEVTVRSDIYSLGLVIYELFTGKRPYEGKSIQQLLAQQEAAQLTSMTSIAVDIDPAVETAIRRCLDPDPAQRPPNSLSVAAALPGGDRLAAALAAGETPSPELVADSGGTEGLKRRYSVPSILVIMACLIACIGHQSRFCAMLNTPLDDPPEVLANKARQMAASFGYPKKPRDSAISLAGRASLLDHLNKLPEPRQWKEWLAAEAPIRGEYRESQSWLYALPLGEVTADNPPPTQPGMVRVNLDGGGRLREFTAVPDAVADPLAQPVEPAAVFGAAGLDMAAFHETPPAFTPPSAADRLLAWKGPHPKIPNLDLTLNLATWKGRVTSAAVEFQWKEAGAAQPQGSLTATLRGLFVLAVFLFGALAVPVLARRNWKLGRIDRQGAMRLAVARFFLGMVVWLGTVHAVPDGSLVGMFWSGAAEWMLAAALLWLLILALEPGVRAFWPHSLVTWNRIMAGRWKDAQVGAHVLIGAAAGSLIWGLGALSDNLFRPEMRDAPGLAAALGTRQWLAAHAGGLSRALLLGLIIFFGLAGLRYLVKRNILAAVIGGLILSMADSFQSPHWQFQLALRVAVIAVLVFVLLRFGLVATIAAMFFDGGFDRLALGADWKTWYAPAALATFALLAAIAILAFWRSLGTQELFGKDQEA